MIFNSWVFLATLIGMEGLGLLALHNAQPCRYVWSAKGEDTLRKIQSARDAMAGTLKENVLSETSH